MSCSSTLFEQDRGNVSPCAIVARSRYILHLREGKWAVRLGERAKREKEFEHGRAVNCRRAVDEIRASSMMDREKDRLTQI